MQPAGSDSVDVDSNDLEVFGEEAEEELPQSIQALPEMAGRSSRPRIPADDASFFHTLKGSGRIVGARNIGEFSWSIENMLNRVIDGTVPVTGDLLQLMDEAW